MPHFRTVRLLANLAALRGRTKKERREIRQRVIGKHVARAAAEAKVVPMDDLQNLSVASAAVQDVTFPVPAMNAEKLLVILVPEHNAMSGGIFSMFSIASHLRRMRRLHGHEVLVMTRPQKSLLTYFRNTNFVNSENVYRFQQLQLCTKMKELYLHVPEYLAGGFLDDLSPDDTALLKGVGRLRINILNQNVKLMPEPAALEGLRSLTAELSQSVAHHAYFSQEEADRYRLPTLLLPAYTDLSHYAPSGFADKERLIIYSPDDAPHKEACLSAIRRTMPDFELVEIRDITFDQFMDLATRCMFSITFGEGFDGYLAQPIHQGGIGFATFEKEFFPSEHFLDYENIFAGPDDMIGGICARMRALAGDPERYADLNRRWVGEYDKLYSYDDYRERVRRLAMGEFDFHPRT